MATLTVRATAGASTRTRIEAGKHTLYIDEPPFFGGEDTAPSPVETLLASIAGCVNAIGRYVAGELGMDLRGMEVTVEGDCDPGRFFGTAQDNRAGFQNFRLGIKADTDADGETLAKWKAEVLARCPVLDNLRTPAPIEVEVTRA